MVSILIVIVMLLLICQSVLDETPAQWLVRVDESVSPGSATMLKTQLLIRDRSTFDIYLQNFGAKI